MDHDPAIALFAAVAAHHGETWVPSDSAKFGTNALRVNGKIYAALTRKHRLLLKLPPARVAALLKAKRAERMESGGRVMNGWITLKPDDAGEWIDLSDEARAFVATETKARRKSR
ncbi:MAG: hypothetical protein OJF55_001525 [Rhodanobacteraceae bacterium]|jgi:hypothetical protein|nr:MAG: hypothetical protein OJF55_001525 [Rhodanobacteraceae bacterium]